MNTPTSDTADHNNAIILRLLMDAEGLSELLAQLRDICNQKAMDLTNKGDPDQLNAPKYWNAAGKIQELYDTVKNEYKL